MPTPEREVAESIVAKARQVYGPAGDGRAGKMQTADVLRFAEVEIGNLLRSTEVRLRQEADAALVAKDAAHAAHIASLNGEIDALLAGKDELRQQLAAQDAAKQPEGDK